jgi:hypothetical protein
MKKEDKLNLTKERLIEATFSLMEKSDDPLAVTSRQIADTAGTKPSMINYCFGSRESLIHRTFEEKYMNLLNEEKVNEILNAGLAPKELLKQIHYEVAKLLVNNYNFTKAITAFVLFKRDLERESFSFPFVKQHFNGRKSDAECKLIAYELSTMMQLIICRKDDIKTAFGFDLDDRNGLRDFINMRIDFLLGD